MIHIQSDVGKLSLDPLWQTQEGLFVPLSEMEGEHLVNCVDYLERAKQQRIDDGLPESEVEHYEHNIEVFRRELVSQAA